MLRRLSVLLLLLNYLLVVGTGCVGRRANDWEMYRPKRAYVHSPTCQQDHQLRLDCFDRCNGDQQHWQPRQAGENIWHHIVAQANGPDVHCLAETALLLPGLVQSQPRPTCLWWTPTLALGILAEPDAPPRRG